MEGEKEKVEEMRKEEKCEEDYCFLGHNAV
jgi:hypothetical protein